MIATFVRFDIGNVATTQARRVLIPLLFILVVGAALPVPGASIVVGAVVAAASVSYPFQADERGVLDTLYATSSISRRDVVLGRYAMLLVLSAVYVGLGFVVSVVAGAARHHGFGWPLPAVMLLIAFGVVVVCVAVQLPWFFALGFTRARPMMFLPVAALSVGGFVAAQAGVLDGTSAVAVGSAPGGALTVVVLVLGVALVGASAAVAVALYRRREL